jgi:hypothetical protein
MSLTHLCFLFLFATGISAAAQDTNFSAGPQYLVTAGSGSILRPIATPTLFLDAPLPPVEPLPDFLPSVANQSTDSAPEPQIQLNLFPIFYGYSMSGSPASVNIELTSETPREVPPSLGGFITITDAESLRARGYGMTLGEVAAYWKAHKPHAPRVFTNDDLLRLRTS